MATPSPAADASKWDSKLDKRKEIAKVTRSQTSQGLGGFQKKAGAKKSERKKPTSGKGFGAVDSGLNFDRRPKDSQDCACDIVGKSYGSCCKPMHDGGLAATVEDLVRARYTSYVYRLPDFLMDTTDPAGPEWNDDARVWKKTLLQFCDDFEFQGLEVGETQAFGEKEATCEFRAKFVQKGTLNLLTLVEKSAFYKDDGKWLYANGEVRYEAQE